MKVHWHSELCLPMALAVVSACWLLSLLTPCYCYNLLLRSKTASCIWLWGLGLFLLMSPNLCNRPAQIRHCSVAKTDALAASIVKAIGAPMGAGEDRGGAAAARAAAAGCAAASDRGAPPHASGQCGCTAAGSIPLPLSALPADHAGVGLAAGVQGRQDGERRLLACGITASQCMAS